MTQTVAADREITAKRVFDAPRELVYRLWTDPQHIGQWWGPRGFTTTTHAMDVRPGGVWRFVMHGPDGTDYQNRITYREVAKNEQLVYDHGGPGESVDFHVTVTFADRGGKTEVAVRMLFPTAEARNVTAEKYGAVDGLNQTLERLADEAAGSDPGAFVVSRTFDAPRELVYRAWTEAERLAQWWGPPGMAVSVKSLDLRPGGVFHWVPLPVKFA